MDALSITQQTNSINALKGTLK